MCDGATPRNEKSETTRWQRDVTDEDCCVFELPPANHCRKVWRGIAAVALLIGYSSAARAEEPPLTVPKYSLPRTADGAIDFNGWLLYPAVRAFAVFSDNLYQSPTNPVSVAGSG